MIFLTKLSRIYPHAILLQTASWACTGLMFTFHALVMSAKRKKLKKLKIGFVHTNMHTTVLSQKNFGCIQEMTIGKFKITDLLSLDLAILAQWGKTLYEIAVDI